MNTEYLLDSLNTIDKMVQDIRLHIIVHTAHTAEDECIHGADCPICTGDWSEFILESDNQITRRKIEEFDDTRAMTEEEHALLWEIRDWLQEDK